MVERLERGSPLGSRLFAGGVVLLGLLAPWGFCCKQGGGGCLWALLESDSCVSERNCFLALFWSLSSKSGGGGVGGKRESSIV